MSNAVRRYPGLKAVGNLGEQYLKGILDVPDGAGGISFSYLVEIRASARYPYRYPLAYEVGGDIPIGADNHKYNNCLLCLDVEAEEIIRCRRGITITDFIGEVLIPHLANQRYHQLTGEYLQEYAHGADGTRQCYEKLLNGENPELWPLFYQAAFRKRPGRNDTCFCGRDLKFKHCHESVVDTLVLIGQKRVENDFIEMGVL